MDAMRKVHNATLSYDGGPTIHVHVLLNFAPGESWDSVLVEEVCKIGHSRVIDYMDCPVASRWTIVNAGKTAATATLDPLAPEGMRSAV
jgi:hypothetical protein